MPLRRVVIAKNDEGQRLDKFLTKAYPNLPQAVLYKCIRTKDVKRNGKRCQISDRLQAGDVLSFTGRRNFPEGGAGIRFFEGSPFPFRAIRGRKHSAAG